MVVVIVVVVGSNCCIIGSGSSSCNFYLKIYIAPLMKRLDRGAPVVGLVA